MEIVKFDASMLDAVTELCQKGMELDEITESLLKEKIIGDPDYKPGLTLIAKKDDELIGFIMGVIRNREDHKMGYVKLLCTHPDYRREGIATALYYQIEEAVKEAGADKMRVYESYPNYYMPGVDPFYTEAVCFFERNGFKKIGDCSNLDTDLVNQSFDTAKEVEELRAKGIVIRRAEEDDLPRLLDWADVNFKAWKGEITSAFNNDPIALHMAEIDGEIIAFSAHETNNKGTGWFGPMGTTEKARGKGVGGVLLKRCVADLKQMGFENATIPWVGPIPFYSHYINSKVKRIFWRYEKILE